MAATIQVHECSGAAVGVNKTSGTIRFKNAINSVVDTADPIIVPTSGTQYSYTKYIRLYMQAAPAVQVINLRLYTDGVNNMGNGITVLAKNAGTTYSTPVTTKLAGATSIFTYNSGTSGSCIDMDQTDVGPFVPADVGSYIGDLVAMQMGVSASGTGGTKPTESIVFSWDEA